jgi:transketolase
MKLSYRERISTREGFSKGLVKIAETKPSIVGIGCDITASVGMASFASKFPERFFSVGIAEQNALTIAAGMALAGKIPFVASYATFIAMRTLDQIRVSVCYNHLPVKIGGAHAGISVGPDGATHQALEDMAALRALPNMVILSPADATQAEKAVIAAVEQYDGPVYIRYGREPMPDFTNPSEKFEIGKSSILREGKHCAIIATGNLVWESLLASEQLEQEGVFCTVINMYSIKPVDTETIVEVAKQTGHIVTAEEHQKTGGLGSAVCEELATHYPVPVEMVGMPNSFGESGQPLELMEKYGMNAKAIIKAVRNVLKR